MKSKAWGLGICWAAFALPLFAEHTGDTKPFSGYEIAKENEIIDSALVNPPLILASIDALIDANTSLIKTSEGLRKDEFTASAEKKQLRDGIDAAAKDNAFLGEWKKRFPTICAVAKENAECVFDAQKVNHFREDLNQPKARALSEKALTARKNLYQQMIDLLEKKQTWLSAKNDTNGVERVQEELSGLRITLKTLQNIEDALKKSEVNKLSSDDLLRVALLLDLAKLDLKKGAAK